MSLWSQSLANACIDASNKTEEVQETLRHLSMSVPRSWWESCIENENRIKDFAKIIYEICDGIELLDEWKNYGLFVALPFAQLDTIEPYKYSIEEYYIIANSILDNNPTVNALGQKVDKLLKEDKNGKVTV